jgi:hypothetical protein
VPVNRLWRLTTKSVSGVLQLGDSMTSERSRMAKIAIRNYVNSGLNVAIVVNLNKLSAISCNFIVPYRII